MELYVTRDYTYFQMADTINTKLFELYLSTITIGKCPDSFGFYKSQSLIDSLHGARPNITHDFYLFDLENIVASI